MEEFLICVGIALAIMVGLGLLIKFCFWLDENTDIDFEFGVGIIVTFIVLTFGVWAVRTYIRENKEAKLKRRRV